MKLSVTKTQEESLYLLRLEGLQRKIELDEATEAYEKAVKIENDVENYVITNNEYYADCPDIPKEHGKRITDTYSICTINENIFRDDLLPKIKEAFKSLYGIENPINFVYSSPMRERKFKAERNYELIATEFLKICGRTEEAEQLEKAIKTYMRSEFKDRLYKLNDNFIGGVQTNE